MKPAREEGNFDIRAASMTEEEENVGALHTIACTGLYIPFCMHSCDVKVTGVLFLLILYL